MSSSNDSRDIRLDTGFIRHPKTKTLKGELGLAGPWALLTLWCFARHYHTDGSLAGKSDAYIEDAAEWSGTPGALIVAMLRSGYLDGPENNRHLHDWEDHQSWALGFQERSRNGTIAALMGQGKTREEAEKILKRKEKTKERDALRGVVPGAVPKHEFRSAPSPTPTPTPNPLKANPPHPPAGGANGHTPVQSELLPAVPTWLPVDAWNGYCEMRVKIRKPLTQRAVQLALKKLGDFHEAGINVEQVLDEAVLNSWQGLFEPKGIAPAAPRKAKNYGRGIDENGKF